MYDELIRERADRYDLDPRWVRAILVMESSLDPAPKPRWEPHLEEHSYGIGQVLPSTALWMVRTSDLFPLKASVVEAIRDAGTQCISGGEKCYNKVFHDPEVGIELAAAYLSYQYKRYGVIEDAVAAYNAGSVRRRRDGQYVNQSYVDKFKEIIA